MSLLKQGRDQETERCNEEHFSKKKTSLLQDALVAFVTQFVEYVGAEQIQMGLGGIELRNLKLRNDVMNRAIRDEPFSKTAGLQFNQGTIDSVSLVPALLPLGWNL